MRGNTEHSRGQLMSERYKVEGGGSTLRRVVVNRASYQGRRDRVDSPVEAHEDKTFSGPPLRTFLANVQESARDLVGMKSHC